MKYFTLNFNILLLKLSLPIKSQTVANLLTVDWTLREDFIKNFQKKSGIFTTWEGSGKVIFPIFSKLLRKKCSKCCQKLRFSRSLRGRWSDEVVKIPNFFENF